MLTMTFARISGHREERSDVAIHALLNYADILIGKKAISYKKLPCL